MRKTSQYFGLVVLCAASLGIEKAKALDLTAPFIFESSQTLPQGVRNPRFVNVLMSIDSKFGGTGGIQPLAQPINRTVRWNDILGMEKDSLKRMGIQAIIQSENLDPNGGPGSTTGQVNSFFNVRVPVLAVGISNRLTLGIAVPIVKISVSADTGFSKSQDGIKFTDKLCASSPLECGSAVTRLNNAVNHKLASYGYETVGAKEVLNLGDVQLVGKLLVYKDANQGFSVKSSLVLPTGVRSNVDAAIDLPTGDGRFQVGGTAAYDRIIAKDYRWNTYGGVMALLPHSMDRRIPLERDNPVSMDKETLTRTLGGVFTAGTSVVRQFTSLGLMAGAGYNIQYMTAVKYSGGSQFSSERYGFLEDLTPSQTLHSATLMAGFSTVEWYQQKKFIYPFQANLIFSHPISGRNVPTNNVFAGELVMFF